MRIPVARKREARQALRAGRLSLPSPGRGNPTSRCAVFRMREGSETEDRETEGSLAGAVSGQELQNFRTQAHNIFPRMFFPPHSFIFRDFFFALVEMPPDRTGRYTKCFKIKRDQNAPPASQPNKGSEQSASKQTKRVWPCKGNVRVENRAGV